MINKMNNKMNNKTTIKEKHYKIINLIIKNTIDEKISNQSVILHDQVGMLCYVNF